MLSKQTPSASGIFIVSQGQSHFILTLAASSSPQSFQWPISEHFLCPQAAPRSLQISSYSLHRSLTQVLEYRT